MTIPADSPIQGLQQDLRVRKNVREVQYDGFSECRSRVRKPSPILLHNFPTDAFCVSRILRREPALTQFETAQIANLCPADAEEAKSIIPRSVIIVYIESLTDILILLSR